MRISAHCAHLFASPRGLWETYPTGAAYGAGPLNRPSVLYVHSLLHRVQPRSPDGSEHAAYGALAFAFNAVALVEDQSNGEAGRLDFDRRLMLQCHVSVVTFDAGLPA